MAFNVDTFRANGIIKGGSRPSLFDVILTAPGATTTRNNENNATQRFRFTCEAAELPGTRIDPIAVYHFGRPMPVAGDRTFDPWTVTVINDEDFQVRAMFESWMNKINAHISNRMDSSVASINNVNNVAGSYKTTAIVQQYGKEGPGSEGGVIRSYKFVGCFPTVLSPIRLGWDMANQISRFDVQFVYDYWVPEEEGDALDKYTGELNPP